MAYKDIILADGPYLYNTIDSGASTVDSGNYSTTPAAWTFPAEGVAFGASVAAINNGATWSGGRAYSPNATAFSTTDFSAECWIRTTQTTAGTFLQVTTSTGASENVDWRFFVHADGRLGFQHHSLTTYKATTAVNDGKWHHVAMAYKRSTKELWIFLDGKQDFYTNTADVTTHTSASKFMYIGADRHITAQTFAGDQDEPAYYKTWIMTAADAKERYEAVFPPAKHVSFAAGAATGSASSPNATVSAAKNVSFGATPATANSSSPNATVSVSETLAVAAFTASATSPNAVVSVVRNVSLTAGVSTASATSPNAVASMHVAFAHQAAVATASMVTSGLRKDDGYESEVATATASFPNATVKVSADYATDFSEYALGAPAGWTTRAGAAFSIAESAAAYSGKWLYGAAGSENNRRTYDPVAVSATGDSLVRVHGSGGILFNWISETDWLAAGFDSATAVYVTGPGGIVTNQPATLSTTGFNWMRVRVADGAIRVRVWADGEAEPTTWNIDYLATVAAGKWGHFAFTNKASAIDYYAVNTTDGGSARKYSKGKEINAVALTATAQAVTPKVTAGTTATVAPAPFTAQAAAVLPKVTTTRAVSVTGGPATASAEMPEALAYSPSVTVAPVPFTARAEMLNAVGLGGSDRSVAAGVMSASAGAVHPAFTNMTAININAVPIKATASTPRGADAVYDGVGNLQIQVTLYSYLTDPFIKVVDAEFGTASGVYDEWFRFGQTTTDPLKNYATEQTEGSWVGSPVFGVRDDNFRPATSFAGDSYALIDLKDNVEHARAITWEAVFRTTSDGTISSGQQPVGLAFSGLEVLDGRLTVSTSVYGTARSYSALGRVDDGKWHHVMVAIGNRGLEMWIDGVSRLVRTPGNNNTATASVPEVAIPVERIGADNAGGRQFTGDILMFAQYSRQVSREAAQEHYYAYVLATVARAGVMTASATSGRHKGRGNKKRALMLYSSGGRQFLGDPNPEPNFAYFRIWVEGSDGTRVYNEKPFNFGPYTVYPRRMTTKRNEYDFSPELFTMDDVTDLEDYDMFFFLDLPTPNTTFDDREVTGKTYNMQPQYENFVASIRRAIDKGAQFWCPQPQLAVDLGFIDRLTVESVQKEGFDRKSFNEDFPAFKNQIGGNNPTFYLDTHFNNQYRVSAQLEGFTDLPGHIIKDVVYWYNFGNPFSIRPDYVKYNAKRVENGLGLGELVYFPTTIAQLTSSATPVPPWSRTTIYSVPEGAYRGTAVAKQQPTINMNGVDVPNPNVDNALTIVIQPGDNVGGRPIGGKVLIDFMSAYPIGDRGGMQGEAETLAESRSLVVQVRPFGTPEQPLIDEYDGYDYDARRKSGYFEWRKMQRTIVGNGFEQTINNEVPFFTESEKYPIMYLRQYPWLERALNWLSIKDEAPAGSVRVLATRSEARATAPDARVLVQRHNTVSTTPAVGHARIVKPAGIVEPNVVVNTLPMTARAGMVVPARVVNPAVMTARAEMLAPTTRGSGQDYVLSLRTASTATLYLKEDAK